MMQDIGNRGGGWLLRVLLHTRLTNMYNCTPKAHKYVYIIFTRKDLYTICTCLCSAPYIILFFILSSPHGALSLHLPPSSIYKDVESEEY